MRFKLSLLLRRAWWKGLALFVSLNLLLLSLRHFRHEVPAGGLKVIGYGCQPGFRCGGWADRQKGIVAAFVIAAILGQEFKVSMPTPCDVGFFLSPRGTVDWRLEPGELTGRNVAWWDMTSHVWDDFVQEFLSLEDPLVLFEADYTFIMANMETVHLLRKHRLAQKITWLQELTVPEIYRLVLTELFDLMPGPRVQFDAFRQALPRDVTLVCAQIRVGGTGDTESFNTVEHFQGLASFLAPYNTSAHRLMFTSDNPAMIHHAQSFFPSVAVQMKGPVTHVDRSTGSDVCGGFAHVILEQLVLSTCHVLVISESGLAKIASFIRNTDDNLFIFHDGIVEKFKRENPFPNRRW
ncbi:uncharacterized protein [Littorina saxatilis]